jgi:hypothetical protein
MLEKKDEKIPDLLQKKKRIGSNLYTSPNGVNQHVFISANVSHPLPHLAFYVSFLFGVETIN